MLWGNGYSVVGGEGLQCCRRRRVTVLWGEGLQCCRRRRVTVL